MGAGRRQAARVQTDLLLACVAEERARLGRRVRDPRVPQLTHVCHHEDVGVDDEHGLQVEQRVQEELGRRV